MPDNPNFEVQPFRGGVEIVGINDASDNKTLVIPETTRYTNEDGEEIEARVVRIGENAFAGCGFEEIVAPESVVEIGEFAFLDCDRLKSLRLAKGPTKIERGAFSGCESLAELVIPKGTLELGEELFDGCGSLRSVSLPIGLAVIGAEAFSGPNQIESIEIPATVERVAERAFSFSFALKEIKVDELNTNYRSIDGVLFTIDGKTLVAYPGGRAAERYDVPPQVEKICRGAFSGCDALKEIALPEGLAELGGFAFEQCRSLKSIVLPSTLKRIGIGAFPKGATIYDAMGRVVSKWKLEFKAFWQSFRK